MDVLATYLLWGNEPGMTLVSSFKAGFGDLQESEKDRTIAKEWLVKEGGVDPGEIQWISLIDDQRITLNGTQPLKVVIEKSTRTPAEVIAGMTEKVRIWKLERKNAAA